MKVGTMRQGIATTELLTERIANEVCPCDDCPNMKKCTEEEMTCQSYWLYLKFGNANYLDREPSHKRYKNVFKGRDVDRIRNVLCG